MSGGLAGFFAAPFATLGRHREILARTTATELHRRYAGSVLGMFWIAVSPAILMTLYALIYLAIFRIQPVGMTRVDYVLYIFSGLIPFLGFMEALNTGASSLSMNKAVLLNTVFLPELVPVRAVLAGNGSTAVGLVLLMLAAVALGKHSFTLLLVPLIWLFLILFVTGLVWVLAVASLVLRDIQHVLVFSSIVLLICSPIAYTPDMATGWIAVIVYANPLSYFLFAIQETVVYGRVPGPQILAAVAGLGCLSFSGGFWIFQKAKRIFFDYA